MEGLKRIERFLEVRAGEALSFWRRRERVFESAGHWYFRTREGIDVGPYRTRFEAEVEADLLKHRLQGIEAENAQAVIRSFMMESVGQGLFANSRLKDDGLRAHWHADIGVLS
jgi:hypothetical protein